MTDPIFPDHELFQDDLKAYIDGELSWLRRLAVRWHLTHCASCHEEIVQMTQVAEDLRSAETDPVLDPTLRAKILAASQPHEETKPLLNRQISYMPPKPSLVNPWSVFGAVGAVILLCLVFLPVFQGVSEKARNVTAFSSQSAHSAASAPSMPTSTGGSYPENHGAFATQSSLHTSALAEPQLATRQVHKEAAIGVQVANPEAASDKVETLVKESGGFVANNTLNTSGDGLKSANMTVKVPVTQFESVLSQIAKLGSVQSKNVTGEDITDKSSDADQTENILESDVQTSEARLKALGPKAKWSDQQAARDLRTQLAQARARIFLLKRMAALSTITVDLSQTPKAAAPVPVTNGFTDGLKANTHDALQSLLSSASALLALVIWLLAYAPIWVSLFFIGRYGLREYRKRA